ncbi:FG-GAP repeat domain-containing protein [Marinimicrobium sp. C2-29]|uniref:FG-GAP repeat domain-containing protein n=1 Tax=Marinimicrobium sp. C2-29 TaxID=3139825 RepID=UPI003139A01D
MMVILTRLRSAVPSAKGLKAPRIKASLAGFQIGCLVLAMAAAPSLAQESSPREGKSRQEVVELTQRYCGGCHHLPSPSLLPRHSWPRVIDSMVELAKNRTGQDVIPAEAVPHIKALYYGSSPEELASLPYIDQPHPSLEWNAATIGPGSSIPQILDIQRVELVDSEYDLNFLVSDGERGELRLLQTEGGESPAWKEKVLAEIALPIKARVVDFNGNGREDILVADLGDIAPSGVLAGKLFLLEQNAEGDYEKKLLMHQLGRVTDIQALDLDDDGDLDLAVAVFGGGDVGEVFWLENQGSGDYQKRPLLGLSGALNLTPVDLNGDGKMDLVTLVAQEHETLIAFINQGKGAFERVDILDAGHPMFGATSMIVEDLNRDGRPDIIFTNGDAFDTQTDPKPYHGVQWLENKGNMEFAAHDIGRFYGAANVAVGDMDGDGDPDLVVSSWTNYWDDERRQSLVWFENTGDLQFRPRPISDQYRGVVPLELVDVTGNGRLDIVTGAFRMDILKEFMSVKDGVPSVDTGKMKADQRGESDRLLLFINNQDS